MKIEMRTVPAVIGKFACVILLAVAGSVGAEVGDAARGEELYYAHSCYGCHGYNGDTGARDLVGTDSRIVADVDTFILYLRLRGDYAPLLPSVRMPFYSESSLSDADARDIFSYIQTLEKSAPESEDIPAFEAILESAGRLLSDDEPDYPVK